MNIKNKTLAVLFVVAGIAILSSCNKDDDNAIPKPVISILELGIGDNHKAYIGADLHIEAEIVAEGKINKISVEIHQEEGSSEEITAEYDEFAGLKNTAFHKHVDIPSTAVAGTYHFHLIVTDQEGNSTTAEEEITIEELIDNAAPEFNITAAPSNGEPFFIGENIAFSGTVTDNLYLEGLLVALVYKDDSIADADVTGDNSKLIVMLHTHTFDSPTSHAFTATIDVGAANDNNMTPAPIQGDNAWKSGSYYILARCKDAKGNWAFTDHYPIVINL